MAAFAALLNDRTKLVAITHVSNALGSVVPVAEVIRQAHAAGAKVLIDGCQAVPHMPVDVRALDADFYVFSGHKLYGPSGVGVLYGKEALLEAIPPYQGGGEMISSVTFEKTTYADLPFKFEAGTPHIAGNIALGAAIDYVTGIGLDRIAEHERKVVAHATERLREINSISLIGTARDKAAIVSFNLDGIHPHDVGTILDREGVAVRTGHHCAQPVMDRFDVAATVRASFGLYNTIEEADALVAALRRVQEIFRV
jgi:cysteine desulfurase/selenocysteine lyase